MIAIQYSRLKEDKMWLACPSKNFQLQECKKKITNTMLKLREPKEIMKTRMHSSMKRTVRFNGHLYRGRVPRGVSARWVSA